MIPTHSRFLTGSFFSVHLEPLEQKPEGNPHPRRTSLPVQEASSPVPAERTPSPARNPQNEALHVKNLVRPFTLNQLKDLLGKHGILVEGGFWIDKIKSHCYVVVRVLFSLAGVTNQAGCSSFNQQFKGM